MAHKCVFILATLATSGAFAVPLNNWHGELASAACASSCPVNPDTKFSFEAGQTYEYRYETDVQTTMGGASEDQSSLHMRSTIQLEVLSRCELVLKVSEVSLQDSNPSQYEQRQHVERTSEFKAALEQNDLRFAYLDGQVENICPNQEEPVWVLNIKRGILSTLQNSMDALDTDKRLFEKDVIGNCPTEYEALGTSWSTRKVKKTKDIIGCFDRAGPHSAFQGTAFTSESDIQSLPLMKSTHVCEQEINSAGIISLSECQESHVFRPFSRHENGARTQVTSKLTFYRQIAGVSSRDGPVRSQMSLTFDHTLSETETAQTVREVKITLSELCTASADDVRPEVPALFNTFIRQVRRLDGDDLSRLFRAATNGICPKAEKFFRDAIPMIGTTGSVKLIRELIAGNQAGDLEAEIWLTSISTSITRPTKEMVLTLAPLLRSSPSRKTYLTVSSLINNYCKVNAGCDDDDEIQDIIGLFEENLRYNCRTESEEQHELVMMALKALGNTGYARRAVNHLVRCAGNEEASMELRIAALQAFRRMPCMADRPELFNLLENMELDSELRINAYLPLMACADQSTINRIRNLLANEQVNQVGSYIWTHLTNLMETSNPLKQDIREILEQEELRKEFNMDRRKFSRNLEMSLFSELINMGGSAESNIIFSEKSFVPRSASLNLTVDMFGQSMNLLEFGSRMQGMEEMLEKVFGPGSEISNALKRQKRAAITDDSVNELNNRYDAKRDDPQVSYFLRLFGNEIRYGDLHNFDTSGLQDQFNYLEFLINLANDHDFDVTKSIMFLDATTNIPTVAGMPLKLEADGSAAVSMNVRGKMDIRRMFTSPSNFEISGSVSPSAALEITSQMGVDAYVARTGLKMVSTLHTSTVLQGKVQLVEGHEFVFDFDVPRDQMEIFSAQSKFFVLWREEEREQNMLTTPQVDNARCVGGSITRVFGLELCGELSYPYDASRTEAPFFPFNGPTTAKVYLNKRETYTGFHFETKYEQQKQTTEAGVQITDVAKIQFNTPESQIDRELTFEFMHNRATHDLSINLRTPWKRATFTSAIQNTDALKSFTARALVDESLEYSITAQLPIEERADATNYEPNVVVVIPGRNNIRLDGTALFRPGRKYNVDVRLRNLVEEPIRVKGSIDQLANSRRTKYGMELEISSSLLQSKIEGFYDNNRASGNSIASRVEVEYRYATYDPQRIVLSHKLRNRSTDTTHSYSVDSQWSSTLFPRYDGEVNVEYTREDGAATATLAAGFDDVRRITLTQTATYAFGTSTAITGETRFQFPLKAVDYQVTLNHLHSNNNLNTQGTIRYGENNEGSLSVVLNKESWTPLRMNGAINLNYPGREMSWTQSINEQTPGQYQHDLTVELQKYQTIQLNTLYTRGSRHEVVTTLQIPDNSPMSVTVHLTPGLRTFSTGLEVTAYERSYSAGYSHTVQGTMAVFSAELEGELSWPERRLTSTTSLTRRNEDFTATIETSWAEGRQATFNGQVTLSKTNPTTNMRVTWPGNFVNLAVQGNIKHQGWYNTEDDMEGSMQFTSSLAGYEQISASLKHDITATTILSEAEVSWAQNKKMDLTFNMNKIRGNSNVETSVQVRSPFEGFRILRGGLVYNLRNNGLTTNTYAMWENNHANLTTTGEVTLGNNRRLHGTATFVSTLTDRITVSASHNDDGSEFETEIETSWAPSKQVSAQFTMRHQNIRKLANNAELTILTPFEVMRMGKISWSHENTDKKITTQVEIEKDGQKGSLEIDAVHKSNNYRRTIQLKSSLQTPFENFEEMSIDISHQHNKNDWENIKSEATIQWPASNQITYEHEIDVNRRTANIKSTFTSPFTNPVSIDMANQYLNKRLTMNNVVTYNNGPIANLEGSGSFENGDCETRLHFTSTCPYLQDITYTGNYQKVNGIHRSQNTLVYAPGKEIDVEVSAGVNDVKSGSIHLRTPFDYVRDVSLATQFTGNKRTFESTTQFEHNLLDREVSLTFRADTANLQNMNAEVDYQGPHDYIFKSTMSHTRNADGPMVNSVTFEIPNHQGSINSEMTIRGWKVHQSTANVRYNDMAMSAGHTFDLSDTSLRATFDVQTPFECVNAINLQLTHEGALKNFNNNLLLTFNGQQLEGTSQFALNDDNLSGSLQITTPYEVLRSMSMNFAHNGKINNFENNAAIVYNGQRYSGNTEFKWYGQNIRAVAAVNIPEQYSIKATSKGAWTDSTHKLVIKMAEKTVTANSAFKYGTNLLETSSSLGTNYQGYENFEMSFNHAGALDNVRTSANIVTPFESVSRAGFEYSHQVEGNTFRSSLTVNTPFAALPTAQFTVTHEGALDQFTTRATTEYNGQTITGVVSFNAVSDIEGSVRLTTTYPDHSNYLASFTHTGQVTSFTTTATLETPYENFQRFFASYRHNGNLQNFECNGLVETRYPGFENINLEISHSLPSVNSMVSSLQLTSSNPQYPRLAAAINHNGNYITMRSTASLETPFASVPRVSYSINHDVSNLNRIGSEMQVTLPLGDFTYSITHNGNKQRFTTNVVITSPFQNYQRFSGNLDHTARSLSDITNNAEIVTPYGNFGYGFRHQGAASNFQTSIEASTPITGYERYALSVQHRGGSWMEINSEGSLSTPLGAFGYHLIHNCNENGMESSFEITTPYASYNRYRVNLEHAARDWTNIRSSSQLTTPHGDASLTLNHNGPLSNMRSNFEILTPFTNYNRFGLELSHNHMDLSDMTSTGTFTSSLGAIGYEFRHTGDLSNMQSSLDIRTPFTGFETMGVTSTVAYTDKTNFRTSAEARTSVGVFSFSLNHNGDHLRLDDSLVLTTPFSGYERFSASINHNVQDYTNLNSNGQVSTPFGDASYTVTNRGDLTDMDITAEVILPITGFERWAVTSEQAIVSTARIGSSARLTTPYGEFAYSLTHNGAWRNMRSSAEITTPFTAFNRLSGNLQTNIQGLTAFTSEASIQSPIGEFSYNLNHNGDLKTMTSSLAVATPFEGYDRFTANVNNNIVSWTNIRSTASLTTPEGDFSYELNHSGNLKTMTTSLTINTPYNYISRNTLNIDNTIQSWTNFRSTARVESDVGLIFSYSVNHNGDLSDMTHETEVLVPISGYDRFGVNFNHEAQTWKVVRSNGNVNTPWGEFAFNIDHNGDHSRMTHNSHITTPFSGFERFGVEINHDANDLTNIRTSGTINTPIGPFGYSLTKTGTLKTMRANAEVTTPDLSFARTTLRIENNIRSAKDFSATATLGLSLGDFSYAVNHNGDLATMTSSLVVSTPFQGYERFSANINNDIKSATDFGSTATVGTPVGEFSYNIAHSGNIKTMTSSLSVATPFQGYERLSASIQNNIVSWTNIESQSTIGTPVGEFSYDVNHKGDWKTMNSRLTVNTPFTGYERYTATIENAITSWVNIRSTATVATPVGDFSYNVNHNGNLKTMNSRVTVNTPFTGYERYTVSIENAITSWVNIRSTATVGTPIGDFSYEVNHSGDLKTMNSRVTVNVPFTGYERYSLNVENNIPSMDNIRSTATASTPIGVFSYNIEQVGSPRQFTHTSEVTTPFTGYERMSAVITHASPSITDIRSNGRFNTPIGEITYNVEHSGNFKTMTSSVEITTPVTGYEQFSLTLSLNAADLTNIRFSEQVNTPFGNFRSGFTFTGTKDDFRSTVEMTTPFAGFESFTGSLEHNHKNLADIVSSALLNTPYGEFTGRLSYEGTPQNFRSGISVNIEGLGRYSLNLNNNCEDKTNINTNIRLSIPNGSSSVSLTHAGEPNAFRSALSIESSFREVRRYEAVLQHRSAGRTDIENSLTLTTPNGNYGYSLNHNGDLQSFRSNVQVNSPVVGNVGLNVEHTARSINNIQSSATLTTPRGNFGMSLDHSAAQENVRTNMEITTPFDRFDRFHLTLSHSGMQLTGLSSELEVVTPMGNYGYSITHEGSGKEFSNEITFTTPYDRFNRIRIATTLNANSLNNLMSSVQIETPAGQFGYSISHVGNREAFRCSAEVTTPYTPYNSFTGSLDYNKAETITTNAVITTSVPGYERFSADVSVRPNPENFELTIDGQSSVEGFNQFTLHSEFSGGLAAPQLLVAVQTPITGHENFRLTFGKSGPLRNMQSNAEFQSPYGTYDLRYSHRLSSTNLDIEGSLQTSISGYERFAFEMSVENKKRMRATIQLDTPFEEYRQFRGRLVHGTKDNNMRSSLTVNTPFSGYDEFLFSMNHNMENNGFNTEVRAQTPVQGYRNFGLDLTHSGTIQEFETSGTLSLPLSSLPELTFRVNHRGNRFDFENSGTLQYNSKTVTVNSMFRRTQGSELNYEGSFDISSPCPWIRDFHLTGAHNRNGDLKTGRLDITHNGIQKVDFDYSYTTSAVKNINIELRKPYPMATQLNLGGQTNDATINWDTTATDRNVHFDFNYRNENNEKEATLRMNLARRTVGFTFSLTNTDERIAQSTSIMWNNLPETRIDYQVEMSKTIRRSQHVYDGQFSMTTPLGSFQSTFNHVGTPGTQYTTEVIVQQLSLRAGMTKSGDKYTHTFGATHPLLPSNTQLVIEKTCTSRVTEGKIEVSFDRQVITYTGRIADDSSRGLALFTANTRLVHEASNTDFQWSGELRADRETRQINTEVSYLTSYDLQRKTASLRTQFQKNPRQISIEWVTPVKSMTFNALESVHDRSQGIHSYELSLTNDESTVRGELYMNYPEKTISIKAFRDEDNYVHALASMPSRRQVQAELYRMNDGTKHIHASASVSLAEDQLISTNFFLSPTISDDFKNFYNTLGYSEQYNRMINEVKLAFNREIASKKAQITVAAQSLAPTIEALKGKLSEMHSEVSAIFTEMYNDNHFYMRTVHETLTQHYTTICNYADAKIAEARIVMERHCEVVRARFETAWNAIREVFTDKVAVFITQMINAAEEFYPYVAETIVNLRNTILNVAETIQNNPTLQWAWNKWQTFDIDTLKEPIFAARDFVMAHYSNYIDLVKSWCEYANTFPQTKYIVAHAKRVYYRSKFAVEYMEVMERVKHIIYELHHINLDTFRADMVERIRNYLQLERTRWTVWNPESGEIGFDLYWPFHWDDMKHLPRLQQYINNIDVAGYVNNVRQQIAQYIPRPRFNVYDIYYRYKPSSDVFNWVPPFKTRAAVIGDQHYMTFDKRFYEFVGDCSYLLAHDFIDGAFSVAVNYRNSPNGMTRRSLTVFSNDKQIEVFTDARVKVDGRLVEMPLTFHNTTIRRMGHVIRVDNTKGVTVDCHLVQNRCTVNVTGWYYGKTAGLFGTYNNEPIDDLTTSGKRRATDVGSFAQSWGMGSGCTAVNHARTVTAEPNTPLHRVCAAKFENEYSSLRPCFKIVDPAPFMEMCVNDLATNVNRQPTEQDTCNIIAAYVDQCRSEGVPVRVPKTCVRCEVETLQTEVTEGQNITLRGDNVPQSADIVFVVEHGTCNFQVVEMIKNSVEELNTAFLKRGIRRNRFAIVGYGAQGQLNAPHPKTMGGEIFNTHDQIMVGLQNFEREPAQNTDVFTALRYASKLPFRVGVSKTLVLVPCSNCSEDVISYGEMQQSIKKLNIHLHVLMPHTFELARDKNIVSAYIFGADRDSVYTRRDAANAELEGDRELRQQLMVPKELCAALAMETEGSVFNTLQWTESRPYMQKRFVDVLVRLIAKKGQPDDCQNCDCVADETGVGKTVCQTCQTTRSFFSFLPGFGSFEDTAITEIRRPNFEYEESTPNPRRLRNMKRNKKRNRKQKNQRN